MGESELPTSRMIKLDDIYPSHREADDAERAALGATTRRVVSADDLSPRT